MPLFIRTCRLAAGMLALPLVAGTPGPAERLALSAIQSMRPSLELDPDTTFAVRRTTPDPLLGGEVGGIVGVERVVDVQQDEAEVSEDHVRPSLLAVSG